MKQVEVTYLVMQKDDGSIILKKDGGLIKIDDCIHNGALLAWLETDLKFELKKKEKNEQKTAD